MLRHLFSLPENSGFLSILFLGFPFEASFPKEFFFQMPPKKVSKIGIFPAFKIGKLEKPNIYRFFNSKFYLHHKRMIDRPDIFPYDKDRKIWRRG